MEMFVMAPDILPLGRGCCRCSSRCFLMLGSSIVGWHQRIRRRTHWCSTRGASALGSRSQHTWGSVGQARHSGSGLLVTYNRRGEGPWMIGDEGHLGTVKAFLKKDPVFKINGRLGIIMKSQVIVTRVALWLRRGATNRLNLAPPILFGK